MILRSLAAVLVLVPPTLPRIFDDEPSFVVESVLLLAVVLVLGRFRIVTALATLLWTALLVFELFNAAGRFATYEDPVLYDGLQLAWHLGVLTMDLYGGPMVAGGILAALVVLGMVSALAGWAFRRLGKESFRIPLGLTVVYALFGLVSYPPMSAGWLFQERAEASIHLYQRVQAFTSGDAHTPHVAVSTRAKPDVRIYILESYGMTTYRSMFAKAWPRRVSHQADRLRALGWDLAATRSLAPTAGGRSWICDAALLTGRQVRYQAEYQALTGDTTGLDHLPGWFKANGYETLLVRPSDRARPGVALQNRFDFDKTYFFKDLEYRGKAIGWGRIPDQYTVGWVHENAFHDEGPPQFSFVHLATAHYPWKRVPESKDDWRDYNTREAFTPAKRSRKAETELWWVAHAWRRGGGKHAKIPERTVSLKASNYYLDAVEHGLSAIVDEVSKIPKDRPTLVLILGDHQPAFISQRGRKDVPVHLAANDPQLLEEFLSDGAIEGWRPRQPAIWHASLYSRLIRTLARYDGQSELPPLLVEGVAL